MGIPYVKGAENQRNCPHRQFPTDSFSDFPPLARIESVKRELGVLMIYVDRSVVQHVGKDSHIFFISYEIMCGCLRAERSGVRARLPGARWTKVPPERTANSVSRARSFTAVAIAVRHRGGHGDRVQRFDSSALTQL